MSKADEMFEKLGFNKIPVVDRLTGEEYKYDYEYVNCDGTWEEHILINDSTKLIHTSNYLLSVGKEYSFILTNEKLQAINEKVKELGWIE